MLLFHTTPVQNVDSIDTQGLLLTFCRTTRRGIWLHTATLEGWAAKHVFARHVCQRDLVAHLAVYVPRSWVVRVSPGLWLCKRCILPQRIIGTPAWTRHVALLARLGVYRANRTIDLAPAPPPDSDDPYSLPD